MNKSFVHSFYSKINGQKLHIACENGNFFIFLFDIFNQDAIHVAQTIAIPYNCICNCLFGNLKIITI